MRPWRELRRRLSPGVLASAAIPVAGSVVLLVLRIAFGTFGVAAYVTEATVYDRVVEHLSLVPGGLFRLGPQGLLTLVLVHDGLFHLAFNVLALLSLGTWVERGLGTRRFLLLCLLATLGGSLLQVAWSLTLGNPEVRVVGASGAVLGVLSAFAVMYPHAQIQFWFAAPMRAAYLLWLAPAIDLIFVLAGTPIAVPVHLGGMIAGILYVRRPWSRHEARRLWADLRIPARRRA
jgi:membrane associated rhomboid family serine protease